MPLPKVRAAQVQWRTGRESSPPFGIPATFVGSAVGDTCPQSAIMIGFAAVMVVAGIRMLRDTGDTGTACEVGDDGINWRRCAPRSIPAGLVVGFLTGLFGVGGGFLIIPALVLMLGVEMPIADRHLAGHHHRELRGGVLVSTCTTPTSTGRSPPRSSAPPSSDH